MSRLQKHLGLGEKVEIDGEMYNIRPLGLKHLSDLHRAFKAITTARNKAKEAGDTSDDSIIMNLEKSDIDLIAYLVLASLKRSLPEENEDDLAEFGLKHMNVLIPAVFSVNAPESENKFEQLRRHASNRVTPQ